MKNFILKAVVMNAYEFCDKMKGFPEEGGSKLCLNARYDE
jgi:hypothetical protein